MKIHVIDAGNFKLDGGAMFGVVPKSIWSKLIPADDLNLCNWKMRCLLVETENRLILIDTGMGNKQSEKWLSYYFQSGTTLIDSIREAGFHENQITDVVFSHLHFDHCGGGVSWNSDRTGYEPTFKNARYWTHSEHFEASQHPNPREKATYLKENILPLVEAEQLFFVDKTNFELNSINFLLADGHTDKMLMPLISYQDKKVLFIADTVPSYAHVHVPFVMGYDIRPLQTMIEKEEILTNVAQEEWVVVFDHDLANEAAIIQKAERGFVVKEKSNLIDFI